MRIGRIAVVFMLLFLLAGSTLSACSRKAESVSLVFVTQPGGSVAGVALSKQPVVAIETPAGILKDSKAVVTLSITSGTGAPGGILIGGSGGPIAVQATNGLASFTGLAVVPPGQGYTLTATSPGIPMAVSSPFDIFVAAVTPSANR